MSQIMLPAMWTNAITGMSLLAQTGSFWLPPPESTTADVVDNVLKLVFYISAFFFLLIVALMAVFIIKYRRRSEDQEVSAVSHNTPLEVAWSVIPGILVVVIFYYGFVGYLDLRTAPSDAYEVRVSAQKWSWVFTYPNGYVSDKLHVPADRPVRLTMTSQDVIHSLFVPAFRIKMDVVPGRYTVTWFRARRPGEYDLYCAEYCGTQHSAMLSKVVVHEAGTFDEWLEEESNLLARMSPAEAGEVLFRRHGCAGCHSVDGTARQGPTLKGVWGQQHTFTNAPPATVDDNYIRESIMDPMAKIRQGYQPVMPTFKGRLKDDEITALIEYIKTLK